MNLWLLTIILAIAAEIITVSSKKALQTKKEDFNSTDKNKPKQSSSKGIINQIWIKVKRLVEEVYNKTFWATAGFFDGKHSYTWKLFGKTIRIVMPRSEKEIKKQLATIQKLIRENPTERCLIVICVNIVIFVISYTILFNYNIYCYFRCRRAWMAEVNDQRIFQSNHLIVGSNLPRNLSSSIRKVGAGISHKQELSAIIGLTSLVWVNKLEEGLLNVPELQDKSDEASSASLMRHHIQQAIDNESKQILTLDESNEESAGYLL
uniref:Bm384, isoform b n=3 Tax=Brugia malayi TaxID=6279 RepID=A0A1I9G1B5_BRUMA|nr:Bm384, isoform b [Brugia malayi]